MTKTFSAIAGPALLALALTLAGCGDDRHDERLRQAGPHPALADLMKVGSAEAGARKFRQCAACHSIMEGAMDRGGPNLFGVYGTKFATNRARYSYTAALAKAGGTWDERTLDVWMADPQAFVPGTTMQFRGVPDALDRADLIAYLRTQRASP